MMHPEWHTDADPPQNDDPTIIDGVKYVPISLSLLAKRIKSGRFREDFTAADYRNALTHIRIALSEVGGPLVAFGDYKYADKLYPRDALTVLALSRTRFWPGFDTDAVLETMLSQWLQQVIENYTIFARRLFEAAHERDCLDGIFLRLNHDIIIQPEVTRISIATKFGAVTQEREPRRQVLTGEARERVKRFLQQQRKFTGEINIVYEGLSRIYRQYDLEQSLISWMGYLVMRAIAQGSDMQVRISGKKLLMLPPAPSANILPPATNLPKLEE